jgi:hypothetical protein
MACGLKLCGRSMRTGTHTALLVDATSGSTVSICLARLNPTSIAIVRRYASPRLLMPSKVGLPPLVPGHGSRIHTMCPFKIGHRADFHESLRHADLRDSRSWAKKTLVRVDMKEPSVATWIVVVDHEIDLLS